jgi:hypothetical protein
MRINLLLFGLDLTSTGILLVRSRSLVDRFGGSAVA